MCRMFADSVKLTMDELRKHHQAFVQSDLYLTAVQRYATRHHVYEIIVSN